MTLSKDNLNNLEQSAKITNSSSPQVDFVQVNISNTKIVRFLSYTVLGLVLANMISQFYKYFINSQQFGKIIRLFYLGSEQNLPTFYSSLTLMLCSVLLAVISRAKYQKKDLYASHWRNLSLIFLYLSIDEAASIHEMFGRLVSSFLKVDGIFYYAWVIPGSILVCIFIWVYLKFLLSLPTKTKVLFTIAGITFLSGALGIELIGSWYASTYSTESFRYSIMVTVEEGLEMLGVLVFIYALIDYISSNIKYIKVIAKNS